MHGLLAARVAVGLKLQRGRSGWRYYLYSFGRAGASCAGAGRSRHGASHFAASPAAQPLRGGWCHEYVQCDLCAASWAARPACSDSDQRRHFARAGGGEPRGPAVARPSAGTASGAV